MKKIRICYLDGYREFKLSDSLFNEFKEIKKIGLIRVFLKEHKLFLDKMPIKKYPETKKQQEAFKSDRLIIDEFYLLRKTNQ